MLPLRKVLGIVSRMESSELLREAERAAPSPFVDYPRTPWWYGPAVGLWWGAVAVVVHLYADGRSSEASALLAALIILEIALIGWLRRRWRVWPRVTEAPPEIRAAYRRYLLGLMVTAVAVGISWWLLGWIVGAVVTALAMTLLHSLYELRVYPRAAARVRERLR